MNLTRDDHDTILAYLVARHRAAGYKGVCLISVHRLAEIHLENSINIANEAIRGMMKQ